MSYISLLHGTDVNTNEEGTIVEITTDSFTPSVTNSGLTVEVEPTNFTISSGGIYSGSLGGNSPQWLSDLMSVSMYEFMDLNYQEALDTYETRLDGLDVGVAQEIVRAQTSEGSLSALITSTRAELNGNIAGVSDIVATKVDNTQATALVNSLVGSKWLSGNETLAESYINDIATTKVSDGFAENSVYQGLISSVSDPSTGLTALATARDLMFTKTGIDPITGELSAEAGYIREVQAETEADLGAKISTVNRVVAGTYHVWDGIEVLTEGMIRYVGSATEIYLGPIIGWKELETSRIESVAETAKGWAGSASSFVVATDVNGDPIPGAPITGWNYADGSGIGSEFKISADKFSLVNANGTATPLLIDATDPNNVQMEFTGKVTLAGLGIDSTTTTINGGLIETDTLEANRLKAGTNSSTVWTGGGLVSQAYLTSGGTPAGNIVGTPQGFRLSANAAGTSDDPDIYGAYIRGATIDADVDINTPTI